MNDFLKNGFICAVFAVLVFLASYDHLTEFFTIDESSPEIVKRDETAAVSFPKPKPQPVSKAQQEPNLSRVEFPKSYYAKFRLVEKTESGVKAIPAGERVNLISQDGDNMLVSFGAVTISTHKDNVRVSP